MFDPPPADLVGRAPLIHVARAAEVWFRSHEVSLDPLFFGRSASHRWDAPDGSYGVLYLAADPFCAFMEAIGRGALRTRFVPAALLKARALSPVKLVRNLRLIDLVKSGGLTRLGAEGSLTSGAGYRNSQLWSEALASHPAKADGIYYRSRYDPQRFACALFERCAPALTIADAGSSWAAQPELLAQILDHYSFGTDL